MCPCDIVGSITLGHSHVAMLAACVCVQTGADLLVLWNLGIVVVGMVQLMVQVVVKEVCWALCCPWTAGVTAL